MFTYSIEVKGNKYYFVPQKYKYTNEKLYTLIVIIVRLIHIITEVVNCITKKYFIFIELPSNVF